MPVSPLNPSDFLHLKSNSWNEEDLSVYFRARPDNAALDTWLLAQMRDGSARSQLLLRTARATHAFKTTDREELCLLIGLPMVVAGPSALSANYRKTQVELEAGLSLALSGSVSLLPWPVPAASLSALGATAWSCLSAAVREPSSSAARLPKPAGLEGAGVWVGEVRAPAAQQDRLQDLLFATAQGNATTRTLLMRAEGLMEEEGVHCRVFPPTALWNAPSIARLMQARMELSTVAAKDWALSWQQGRLTAQGPSQPKVFLFPEELAEDIAPLLSWFEKRRNMV